MNATESTQANEWNHHHAYLARPLSDSGDSTGDWTNGMMANLPPAPSRNGQGQMQDRATRLLMQELAGSGRRIRG